MAAACHSHETDLQYVQGTDLMALARAQVQRSVMETTVFPGMEDLEGTADSILSLLEIDPEDGRADGSGSGPPSPVHVQSPDQVSPPKTDELGLETVKEAGAVGLDAIDQFLCDFASPTPLPLLPPPAEKGGRPPSTPKAPGAPALVAATPAAPIIRSSGRLAAKPTYGLTAEEKALRVLLKRSGVVLHDGPPGMDELQRYKELYKKPLPQNFISAVSSLVVANKKNKPKHAGSASAAAPAVAVVA